MEYAVIEREFQVNASPEVVFEVLSSPQHIREWWGPETELGATVGETGHLTWSNAEGEPAKVVAITVVDSRPPRLFAFRWTQPTGEAPRPDNSLLVTFELTPVGPGTLVRFTETGFREQGWSIAHAQERHQDHTNGWNAFLPRLADYAAGLVAA